MLVPTALVAIGLTFLGAHGPAIATSSTCESSLASAGLCSSNNGTSITVGGERSTPSIPGSSPGGHSSPGGSGTPGSGPRYPEQSFTDDSCQGIEDDRCWRAPTGSMPGEPTEPAPGAPAITITDLASFSPASAHPLAEPGNAGVVGMPANFVAAAATHIRTGTLFGAPVAVRFTPVGYDFHYGDGAVASLNTGGETWDALGLTPFTPTATSHVYRERGTYIADVTVRYAAEVDLGTGWQSLEGELAIPGPGQEIRIFVAHTALVGFTCDERPTGAGC